MDTALHFIHDKGHQLLRQLSLNRDTGTLFSFSDGASVLHSSTLDRSHLSVKGAILCELTELGLPVPPGFIISTDNFIDYITRYDEANTTAENPEIAVSVPLPDALLDACKREIRAIEHKTGRLFGRVFPENHGSKLRPLPLLFSVRIGTSICIPGATDAILNVGLTDAAIQAIVAFNPGYLRFALDCQRRFLHAYGLLVLQKRPIQYQRVLDAARRDAEMYGEDGMLTLDGLKYVVGEYRRFTKLPDDPFDQLQSVIEALYEHALTPRVAEDLHSQSHPMRRRSSKSILEDPEKRGVALIVEQMVYGNLNSSSGSGACFSRRISVPPASEADFLGESKDPDAVMPLLGEFLAKGEGREVFDSEPTTHSPSRDMARFREMFPQQYVQLQELLHKLERSRGYPQYVEFTVEDGTLFILDATDVNFHGRVKDARFVPYYNLLLAVQREDEMCAEDKK